MTYRNPEEALERLIRTPESQLDWEDKGENPPNTSQERPQAPQGSGGNAGGSAGSGR
jgi:hypothetical protein